MTEYKKALADNINRVFTFEYAVEKHDFIGSRDSYEPITFFNKMLKTKNPFYVFMELEGHRFQAARNQIVRYKIPYTIDQEKQAKSYTELMEEMANNRSDYAQIYLEIGQDDKIVLLQEPHIYTTKETLNVHSFLTCINTLQKTSNIIYDELITSKIKTNTEQMRALKNCLEYKYSCLIGGAGTGKSFVTAEIINQLLLNGKEVTVLAPTHKAREALQEKLNQRSIPIKVKTIHSYVYKKSETDVIIIDEAGMLSTELLSKITNVLKKTQTIFVGDKNQLEPINYGRPFERLQKILKVSELFKNNRSEAADIVALGREILNMPQNDSMGHPNIRIVEELEGAYELNPDIYISYKNKTVDKINEHFRLKHNNRSISPLFAIGERILAEKNYAPKYYNGQTFIIDSKNTAINEKTGAKITFSTQTELERNFTYAYALTVHKSQGSEWDNVAFIPSEDDTQNLAYVAITRAKRKLIIVGDKLKGHYEPQEEWSFI